MFSRKHHGDIMVQITGAESGDSLDTSSERTVHPSAEQGSFGPPKASAKEDAPGLHGVEHRKKELQDLGECPGQSPRRWHKIED